MVGFKHVITCCRDVFRILSNIYDGVFAKAIDGFYLSSRFVLDYKFQWPKEGLNSGSLTYNVVTQTLWPCRLGNYILCKRFFLVETLLWSLEFVFQNKSRAQHHRKLLLVRKCEVDLLQRFREVRALIPNFKCRS